MIKYRVFLNQIPNFITSLNLFCGTTSIVFAFQGELVLASLFILIAAIFDFVDGFAARLLNAYSEIGKQFDSLADLVSFGVAPAAIIYNFLIVYGRIQEISVLNRNPQLLLLVFVITIFSALRLAKFNVDSRQTTSFIGLPTPANAIFWASFPLILEKSNSLYFAEIVSNPIIIFSLILIMSYLLVAEIPMFSLKFKNLKIKENLIRFIFILIAVLLFVVIKIIAIPIIIIAYILVSIFENIYIKK